MSIPDYTLEELRASLRHTGLATLITEGRDDYSLMRNLQREIGHGDCLPAGGKANVLALHGDDHTFSCPKSGYLVDSDLWLFTGVPAGLSASAKLVCTDGYSIENDTLRDAKAESLLYANEIASYQNDLSIVVDWYAAGVTARLGGHLFDFDRPLARIIDPISGGLTLEAQADIAAWPPTNHLVQQISADHTKLLRGKTWLSLLTKYLCARHRQIQHSPRSLLEIGMRGGGPYSVRLITELRKALA